MPDGLDFTHEPVNIPSGDIVCPNGVSVGSGKLPDGRLLYILRFSVEDGPPVYIAIPNEDAAESTIDLLELIISRLGGEGEKTNGR